ncbi:MULTISPECIES: lipid asymmetry maintenance protein MlaB [unclassified Polaromonas]|uniref:STAS domain-containing protein n=1 Tax=unclassified Polaromonas TaxID=2638319 RepID=UPI000F07B7B8|nr:MULTISPECIES: STAS domain-containing protein [unclassified Polaromonas]AYQ28375.1 STAS domain-containing protein [Polaromonas sp. SP1]QGJ20505.1 STAS domain-containing protein [Polaromonas sp. Pch-P]
MLTLPSVLTHAEAAGFAHGLKQAVLAQPAEVVADAGALEGFDSSALAVLLECRREALAAGKAFSVSGLPARLRQLAGLYGVAELIPATAAPAV